MLADIPMGLGHYLIKKILDAMAGQLKHLGRPKPRIEQLIEARAELKAKVTDINNNISRAEREGQIPTDQVRLLMSDVNELEGKAAAIEQDFERWSCLGGWSWNCFSVNRRVAKRLKAIDKLKTRTDATPVATEPPPPAIVHIPTSSSTLGMEAYMRNILNHIASASVGVIGVYGMGGVGKTTLLKSINNHRDVAAFDHVIWAVASKEYKIERLQMDIAKRLKLHLQEDDSEEDRAAKLFDFLKNKDCLLLLDDMWAPLDLAKLGMVLVSSGEGEQRKRKVVVFTTRYEQVCSGMKASRKMQIKCLEPEQAWKLFRRNAGEDAIGTDAGINRIAHQIAKECAGLPLALVTVGVAMSTKKSWEAWNDALTRMKQSELPKVIGMKEVDPMFSAFKLSYDSLEDDDLRGCLLSCALWPEDYLIKKDDLIECWMGLGLINEVGAIHKAYNRGHSHIEALKAACLLEPGNDNGDDNDEHIETLKAACLLEPGNDNDEQNVVKMHDVIRDMALWMASDCGMNRFKWIVRTRGAASQALEEKAWHEVEQVSLMYSDITYLPNQLSTSSKLSVLMLQHNTKLIEIQGSLIQAMCALTYLDLKGARIRKIPKEIGMLSQLQHLNMSWTSIRELPAELGCLVNLKYLLLKNTTFLSTVAKGALSKLSSLKLLDLRGSEYNKYWDELKSSEACHISIGIDITASTDLQCLCSLTHVSAWRLNVKSWTNRTNPNQLLDDFIRSHNIRQSIEQLNIAFIGENKLLISEGNAEAGGLDCLTHLMLLCLFSLEEITWKGVQPEIVFPNLRELRICWCHGLRNVNWALQLPSLSLLDISICDMEELISNEGNPSSSSFSIRRMRLDKLPRLKRISSIPLFFPYLQEIRVQNCPLLERLPFDNRISMNSRLKVIRCEQKWWGNLQWEDVSIKDSLLPLCKYVIR